MKSEEELKQLLNEYRHLKDKYEEYKEFTKALKEELTPEQLKPFGLKVQTQNTQREKKKALSEKLIKEILENMSNHINENVKEAILQKIKNR